MKPTTKPTKLTPAMLHALWLLNERGRPCVTWELTPWNSTINALVDRGLIIRMQRYLYDITEEGKAALSNNNPNKHEHETQTTNQN